MKKTANKSYQVGLIFGKFYPLHCGHIYLIEKAVSQVDELHIMLGCEAERDHALFKNSQLPVEPLVKDRFYWLQETFKSRLNIHIHILDEAGIAYYPNGWKDWSDRVKSILHDHQVTPTVIFTSEAQDAKNHELHYGCPVKLIDVDRELINISATQIRNNPYKNWDFIAKVAKPFFVKKVALVGKDDKFNQLAQQLANIFNTTFVSNGYINYIHREHVYGQQRLLDESDYLKIAMIHADRIDKATNEANRVVFTSLDFKTLHDYYQKAFNGESSILKELQDNYHFDLVINEADFGDDKTSLEIFESVIAMIQKKFFVK